MTVFPGPGGQALAAARLFGVSSRQYASQKPPCVIQTKKEEPRVTAGDEKSSESPLRRCPAQSSSDRASSEFLLLECTHARPFAGVRPYACKMDL